MLIPVCPVVQLTPVVVARKAITSFAGTEKLPGVIGPSVSELDTVPLLHRTTPAVVSLMAHTGKGEQPPYWNQVARHPITVSGTGYEMLICVTPAAPFGVFAEFADQVCRPSKVSLYVPDDTVL